LPGCSGPLPEHTVLQRLAGPDPALATEPAILLKHERIKRQTIQQRRLLHQRQAA
jgi:hypothetical protein